MSRVAYDVLVGLHVVSAVAGFGAVALSGAYGAIGRRPDARSTEEVARFFARPGRAGYLLALVAPLGGAALAVRPGGPEFGDLWVTAGFVIWTAACGLYFGVVRRSEAALRTGAGCSAPAAGRLMWAAVASDALFVIALFVMVTQPA